MVEMGKELVKQCSGLPLAVKRVALILSSKQTLVQWKSEYYDFNAGSSMRAEIAEALASRYYDLPHTLRLCFLYLFNLVADMEIEIEKVYHLWIAEDFITFDDKDNREETKMDVAKRYFNELVVNKMVQVQVEKSTGQFKSCRIYYKMQELYSSTIERHAHDALIDLESGVEQVQLNRTRIQRLFIRMGKLEDLDNYCPPEKKRVQNTRTVLFCLKDYSHGSRVSKVVQSHLSDFKLVSILDLGGLVFSRLDEAIGSLICLRYLGLRYTVFHELPSSVANMTRLETLDISDSMEKPQFASTSIPNVLRKLEGLRHLYLRSISRPNGQAERISLHGLKDLEILENLDLQAFDVKNLDTLTNLRRLRANISEISNLEEIATYLNNIPEHLNYLALSIRHCDLYSETGVALLTKLFESLALHESSINGRTGLLPKYNEHYSLAPCLIKLTFESTELRDDPMPMLEKLPNLRSLYLRWNAFLGDKMVCSSTGFPQLIILQVWRAHNLKELRVDEGGMCNLSLLQITYCPNLRMVPDGLRFLRKLQELEFLKMPEAFIHRLRVKREDGITEGAEFYKVKHVHSIKIDDHHLNEPAEQSDHMQQSDIPPLFLAVPHHHQCPYCAKEVFCPYCAAALQIP